MGVSLGGINVGHPGTNYEKLISKTFSMAIEWLGKHATKSDVVVLFPCGSSRAELLRRLLVNTQYFSKAYVYKGFKEKLEYPSQEVEEYESIDELADKLKNKAEKPLAVVPESSFDALLLKDRLKQVSPNIRVKLLYLPALYSRAAKELNWPSKDVKKLATVEHTWLGKAYKHRAKGYSSTLLRDWKDEELEELKKAKEAILALSPGRLGLRDYLTETLGKMIFALATAPFGVAVALAVDQLLRNLASLNIHEAAQMLLNKVGSIPARHAENFASRVLEGWSRPEAKNKVAEGLAKLVVAAKEAAPHLDREELETVIDQVALEWGMDVPTFKVFVKNLAKLASGEVVTREELRKELEKLMGKELEERLKQLIEEELDKVERELRVVEVVAGVHFIPETLGVQFDKKGILLRNVLAQEKARYIPNPQEEELFEAFEAMKEGGVVVVKGKKGEGKSSLTKAFLAKLMLRRPTTVIELRDAAVDVDSLKNSVDRIRVAGRTPVLYYDPSKTGTYSAGAPWSEEHMPAGTLLQVHTVASLVRHVVVDKHVPAVVVLSDDLYDLVKEQLLSCEGLKVAQIEVSLKNEVGFLAGLVEEYSAENGVGCKPSVAKHVARAASRYRDNRAIVAVLVADWLKRSKCDPSVVKEALERAKGRVEELVLDYIWYAVLGADRETANTFAPLILLTAEYGPTPWRLGEELLIALGASESMVRGSRVIKWFSQPLHGTVLEGLRRLARSATGEEAARARSDLVEAVRLARHKIEKLSLDDVGNILEEKIEELLPSLEEEQQGRWRRLALIAGSALTAHPIFPRAVEETSGLPGDALKPCKLDGYLLVGGEIPSLVVRVVLQRPSVLAHPLAHWHGEAAKELEKLVETWRSMGGMYLSEAFYGLGLALAVAGAFELGESVEAREAEAALYTATSALQQVLSKESATIILDFFRRLGGLAPHYYVLLASATSELLELEKETAHKITESLEEALEREELKVREWSLVEAVKAYSNLLTKHRKHFLGEEEQLRERMCKLLEWLEGQLRDIAEVYTLQPALEQGLKPCGGADPAGRAEELLKRLKEMEKEEPSRQAAEWATVVSFKPERFKLLVKHHRGALTFSLARYKMDNDDLEAARKLFTVSAEIDRELKHWGVNYLNSRSWATRCSVLGAESLEELIGRARAFEELWKETEKQETLKMAYLQGESLALAEYLVFLALEDRKDEVSELLERKERLLQLFPEIGVIVKLFLELLGVEVGKPEAREVATALNNDIMAILRPIFFDALSGAIHVDREATLHTRALFRKWLGEKAGKLPWGEGSEERETAERFYRELLDFVDRRDASAVVQLLAPENSIASFTLMLWALVNGDKELARAHAKLGAMSYKKKLPRRLYREVAEARSEEELKLALLKLFYLHF